jgi:hypothetical protein
MRAARPLPFIGWLFVATLTASMLMACDGGEHADDVPPPRDADLPHGVARPAEWPERWEWVHEWTDVHLQELPLAIREWHSDQTTELGTTDVTIRFEIRGSTVRAVKEDGTTGERFEAQVFVPDYGHLCYLLESTGLASEGSRNWSFGGGPGMSHATYDRLVVTLPGQDEPVVLESYEDAEPIELWGVQTALRRMAEHLRWKPVK